MADIEKIARDLCNMSQKELDDVRRILKDEYNIEPKYDTKNVQEIFLP